MRLGIPRRRERDREGGERGRKKSLKGRNGKGRGEAAAVVVVVGGGVEEEKGKERHGEKGNRDKEEEKAREKAR